MNQNVQLSQAWTLIEAAIEKSNVAGFGSAWQEDSAAGSSLVISWRGRPPLAVTQTIEQIRSQQVEVRIEECAFTAQELDHEARRLIGVAREEGLTLLSIGPNAKASGLDLTIQTPSAADNEFLELEGDYPLSVEVVSSANPRLTGSP